MSLGEDYYTIITHYNQDNESAAYYEKSEDGNIRQSYLKTDNTVADKAASVRGESEWSKSACVNVFGEFDFGSDKTEYVLGEEFNTSLQTLNYQLCNMLWGLTPDSSKFYVDGGKIKYESVYETVVLKAEFFQSPELGKIEALPETEESAALKARITELKANNYTLDVYTDDDKTATVEATANMIRVVADGSEYGFNKTPNGYNMVKVEDGTVYLEQNFSTPFEDLLPGFKFSADVFEYSDNKYVCSSKVSASDVADTFKVVDFVQVVYGSYLTFSLTDDKLTVSSRYSANGGTTYRLEFTKAGNTSIAVDLSDYEVKATWASESIDIADAIVALLGSEDALPYYNPGAAWYLDLDSDSRYMELINEDIPEESFESVYNEYCALLAAAAEEKGYALMTAAEIDALENDGNYYFWYNADSAEEALVYRADEYHTIEVYFGFDYPYGVVITVMDIRTGWLKADEELGKAVIEMLGGLNALPYYDAATAWYSDIGDDYKISADELSVTYAQAYAAYCALLEKKGYLKLTADEVTALELLYSEDEADGLTVYRIDDTHVVEVFYADVDGDSWLTGFYICVQTV